MTKRKSKSEPATDNLNESTQLLADPESSVSEPTHLLNDPESSGFESTHLSQDSGWDFGNAAHLLGGRPDVSAARTAYQRARVNCFIPPAHRQQLDELTNEWNCPLTEAVRRVLALGLSQIMQADQSE
jgi:hypothetical protein